jgi:hypothetical protein
MKPTKFTTFKENLSPLVLPHDDDDAPSMAGDADDCLAAPPAPAAPHRRPAGPIGAMGQWSQWRNQWGRQEYWKQ